MQNFRSLGLIEKKLHHFFQNPKLFFLEIGKNKFCPMKMFAKQKSYLIIDIEKQKKIQGCQMHGKKVISFLKNNI